VFENMSGTVVKPDTSIFHAVATPPAMTKPTITHGVGVSHDVLLCNTSDSFLDSPKPKLTKSLEHGDEHRETGGGLEKKSGVLETKSGGALKGQRGRKLTKVIKSKLPASEMSNGMSECDKQTSDNDIGKPTAKPSDNGIGNASKDNTVGNAAKPLDCNNEVIPLDAAAESGSKHQKVAGRRSCSMPVGKTRYVLMLCALILHSYCTGCGKKNSPLGKLRYLNNGNMYFNAIFRVYSRGILPYFL
jgi:hypothetical protein